MRPSDWPGSGMARPFVHWFDAHADLHTPDSTESGFLDGMALSVVLGRCWPQPRAREGLRSVPEDRVWLIGARDVDPKEAAFLACSSIRRLGGGDGDALAGEAAAAESIAPGEAQTRPEAYVHVDLDVLDPSVCFANAYAAPDGMDEAGLTTILNLIASRMQIRAAALAAYDPGFDEDGRAQTAALRIAAQIAGLATNTEA